MNLTFICLFIVMTKSIQKYITKIGQNTGILNASKNVHPVAMTNAFEPEYLQRKIIYQIKVFNLIPCVWEVYVFGIFNFQYLLNI